MTHGGIAPHDLALPPFVLGAGAGGAGVLASLDVLNDLSTSQLFLLGVGVGVLVTTGISIYLRGSRRRRGVQRRVLTPQAPVGQARAREGVTPDGESPSDLDSLGPARPHWQRLILELRGSCAGESDARVGEFRFTQKALAETTGISVKRVSEFPTALNATAAQKLDGALPEWRRERALAAAAPTLVETHKGAVLGRSGTWVYYRLTEWGERLAAAIDAEDDGSLSGDEARGHASHEASAREAET